MFPIFLRIGFMILIIDLECILGSERLPQFGCYGYIEMIKFSLIKTILGCMLFTSLPILSVYGRLYNTWRIEIYLWKSIHGWRPWRGILVLNMGSCILRIGPPLA
jgi:hypothetical protein